MNNFRIKLVLFGVLFLNSCSTVQNLYDTSHKVDVIRVILADRVHDFKSLTTKEEYNEFFVYAIHYGAITICKFLLESGIDVNYKYQDCTFLLLALNNNLPEIVTQLIKAGSDVNYRTANGVTSLHIAAKKNLSDTAQYLIESGAKILNTSEINEGRTMGHLFTAAVSKSFETAEVLINSGADVNDTIDTSGGSVLMAAVVNNDLNFVKLLIQSGANINYKAKNGKSAISLAKELNFTLVTKILLDADSK